MIIIIIINITFIVTIVIIIIFYYYCHYRGSVGLLLRILPLLFILPSVAKEGKDSANGSLISAKRRASGSARTRRARGVRDSLNTCGKNEKKKELISDRRANELLRANCSSKILFIYFLLFPFFFFFFNLTNGEGERRRDAAPINCASQTARSF